MSLQTRHAGSAPRQLFFQTAEQRTALARQMFFEEGARPTGLVGEAVIQSWMRCASARSRTAQRLAFEPVSASRLHSTLNRNRELLEAARRDLSGLEASLAGTDCRVLLTDPRGVIVHATHHPLASQQPLLKVASRIGVNIAESIVGTTAPGIVSKTGQACTVTGAEHFFDCLRSFQCAAAPIRDVQGRLAAVLDLSVESRAFGFDAASMVGLYAVAIENRLLQAQSREHLVLRFQSSPAMLGTPLEALAGITEDGRLAWLNGVGARLMDLREDAAPRDVEAVFGLGLAELLQLTRCSAPRPVRLRSGLGVWLQARLQSGDGADFNHAVGLAGLQPQAPPAQEVPPPAGLAQTQAATLGDHSRKLIESTLAACGGNLARAARTLGVSRGTLYRRLRVPGAVSG